MQGKEYSFTAEKLNQKLYLSLNTMAGTEPGTHYQRWPQTLPICSNAALSIQHFCRAKNTVASMANFTCKTQITIAISTMKRSRSP